MKLADLSGRRKNRALGGVSPREKAEIEHGNQLPKREVPPELDPRTFDARAGLTADDEGDRVLQRARRAYAAHGERLKDWHHREAAIHGNQFELPAKKRVLVSQMVLGELGRVTKLQMDAREEVVDAIAELDKEMLRGFRNRLKADESREIREYVRGLTKSERAKFLHKADDDVLCSVMAAKPFLSGLTDAEALKFHHEAVQRFFPSEVARRKKLERAKELLEAVDKQFVPLTEQLIDKQLEKYTQQEAAMKKAVAGAE